MPESAGPVYKSGILLQLDQQPVSSLLEAAELGYPDAQFVLANKYALGEDVPQDEQEAAKWYRRAAERPISWKAKILLGLLLLCPFGKRAGGQKNSGGSTRCASTAWTWRCFGRVLAGGVVGGEGQVREGAAEKGVSSTS